MEARRKVLAKRRSWRVTSPLTKLAFSWKGPPRAKARASRLRAREKYLSQPVGARLFWYRCSSLDCARDDEGCACDDEGCACDDEGCACDDEGCACDDEGCACDDEGCACDDEGCACDDEGCACNDEGCACDEGRGYALKISSVAGNEAGRPPYFAAHSITGCICETTNDGA